MNPDWESIKQAYIGTSESTLKCIAKEFGIPYARVAKRSAQEGWAIQKKKQAPGQSAATAIPTSKALPQADKINEIAAKLLDNIRTGSEYSEAPSGIYNLSAALKTLTAVLRDVNDIPSLKEQRNYELAKEKLEQQRKKTEQVSEAAESGVVMLPEVTGSQGEQM